MSAPLIGLIAHTGKANAARLVASLRQDFAERSAAVRMEQKTAALLGEKAGDTVSDLGASCDILVVLGGDGTILQVLHDLAGNLKPIFGINLGTMGFLTCVRGADHTIAVECILAGKYVLSNRTLLDLTVERGGETITCRLGLNDAVISRGALSRLIRLETRIDGAVLTEYNADGLIIATPTGSTAYALSAGGPVLMPESGVFLITPICPHVLTNRSLIVDDASTISVRPCREEQDVFLTVDGQELLRLRRDDVVRIRKASAALPLAMLPEVTFFEVLQQKLKWSGAAI